MNRFESMKTSASERGRITQGRDQTRPQKKETCMRMPLPCRRIKKLKENETLLKTPKKQNGQGKNY